ncbi:PEP/pyruvate-binding domain-containing protein [Pseudodesulfovibrio sp. S3]|uniref:PEP/pyruvate-binding domain-containing protein n=1 Tax=unclassified Pseudodesulfovibrio TaxID=2661612 RepID=UPI0013E3FB61|nr:PEP/pyruvate-binding domain-containing protein [Pseudodesulfovibrio sp. S3]MCJ2165579.1 PEP-utilizing enzyme [Pseudodesulfovibrio sp. S3-i]
MKNTLKTLFNFIHRNPDEKDETAELFLAKSENFRLLLSANNEALELMAEMTGEAQSDQVFGISHVRAQSLKVASGVRQMIERLCLMAPGKYEALRNVFNNVVQSMDEAFESRSARPLGPVVLEMKEVRAESLPETGSKVALLGEIRARLGVDVPHGFSITVSAFRMFMESTGLDDEISRLIQIHDGSNLEQLYSLEKAVRNAIDLAQIPVEIEKAVQAQCARFGNIRFAVRSSALDEDSEQAGFAGQFKSVLGVRPANLMEAYRAVLASMYSATAMTYIRNRGLREDDMIMAVGCMEMIDARAGGVVYTRSPMGDDDTVVVNAVCGLPCAVVDGSSEVDSWIIDRTTQAIVRRDTAEKEVCFVLASGGKVRKERLYGDLAVAPSITDADALRLAAMAMRIEDHFSHPQDIEWAQARDGKIVILQSRPLTVSSGAPETVSDEDESRHLALLSGCTPASPGAAFGYVVKVETKEDMFGFPDGAVLLARNARPQLSALLPKAAALVTEFGSPVGHLANVAREYGVPALIGAPGAIERLSGVGLVTVNGSTGTVYLGHRQKQIDRSSRPAPKPRVSDVGMALKNVLAFITPLNLTDPESPDFRPESCRSLHDITRYCHEKAVAEMFTKGSRPVSSARRLTGEKAMQYWLVDLGGGTAESAESKSISIEDVRSNAMKALWFGMMAVPWEGPPPVCIDGFMSVLSSAARNPALAPGAMNDMGERNYFIVGRNYCNLQSRFGFHFCTIEGFAGDDSNANYALFQFKGGGADMGRRHSRAQLVEEVLERHGFIVEIKEDALFARLEGVSREAVEEAMAILGYLLMHTRQIDMSMADSQACARYRNKFENDIGTVLSTLPTEHGAARYVS